MDKKGAEVLVKFLESKRGDGKIDTSFQFFFLKREVHRCEGEDLPDY